VKKAVITIAVGLMIYFAVMLPDSAYPQPYPGYVYFWARVLDADGKPVSNAVVIARKTSIGDSYPLTSVGYGYYYVTLEPGSYDLLVNGTIVRRDIYASAFWYVMIRCYLTT
jgi:hypothetical protein